MLKVNTTWIKTATELSFISFIALSPRFFPLYLVRGYLLTKQFAKMFEFLKFWSGFFFLPFVDHVL